MNQPMPTIPQIPTSIPNEENDASAIRMLNFLNGQPPFLVENWRKIIASGNKDAMKCMMVTKELTGDNRPLTTVNITSAGVLVRNALTFDVVEGAYLLTQKPRKMPPRSHWDGYPLIKIVEPDFKLLAAQYPELYKMPQDVCGAFATFCSHAKDNEGTIVMTGQGAFIKQSPDKCFNYPFNTHQPVLINPHLLQMAFTEAQRYDWVYIVRQYDEERGMPLFIGKDWGNCVMVSTQRNHQLDGYCSSYEAR